jgi:two-component system, LytTR family, response regulator
MTSNKLFKPVRSIIIDDEQANRNLLSGMLRKHCPAVQVESMADSAAEGYRLIRELQPDLVFLDVQMPEESGFDLLRKFSELNFHVIFVSAFDQYAINAFEFNAIDYILKPIDHIKLARAVGKAEAKIAARDFSGIVHFISSLDDKNQIQKRISLHHNDKVHMVNINEICFVQAVRNYSEIVLTNEQKYISSKALSEYESMLEPFDNFLRVNKSTIVNINHIKDYTKGTDCVITIGNNSEIEVSRRKKSSIIHYLKNVL